LDFPECHQAHKEVPKPFHKSFFGYLSRSGLFTNIKLEARQIMIQCALRVLKEAPNGYDCNAVDTSFVYGKLAPRSGTGDKISITWPARRGISWDNARTRLSMYQLAIGEVVQGIARRDLVFQTKPYIDLLITQFKFYDAKFPFNELGDLVFVSVP
jgi:hypothetical protein